MQLSVLSSFRNNTLLLGRMLTRCRFGRVLGHVARVATVLATASPSPAAKNETASSLQVIGTARFELVTPTTDIHQPVRGALIDELGAPIRGASIEIAALNPNGTSRGLVALLDCALGKSTSPDTHVTTDGRGHFCARVLDALAPREVLEARFTGSAEYRETRATLPANAPPFLVSFPNAPPTVSIDRPITIPITVAANPAVMQGSPSTVQLQIRAQSGAKWQKLHASTVPLGQVTPVVLDEVAHGDVGPLVLIAQVTSTKSSAKSEFPLPLWRTSKATITAALPPRLLGTTCEVTLEVRAKGHTQPEGSLALAVLGGTPSFAELSDGRASLALSLPDSAIPGRTILEARFIPLDARWESPPPLRFAVPLPQPPSPLPLLLWAALGLGLFGWMAWRNRAMGVLQLLPKPYPTLLRHLAKHIPPLLRRTRTSGIEGQVRDRAEGLPIANARVVATISGFSGALSLGAVDTDSEGRFHLPSPPHPTSRVTLTVQHPFYQTVSVEAEGISDTVLVELESLRRAALRDLNEWAEIRGHPYADRPLPTPGSIATIAERRAENAVLQWAKEVESVAFGPEEGRPVPVRPPT